MMMTKEIEYWREWIGDIFVSHSLIDEFLEEDKLWSQV